MGGETFIKHVEGNDKVGSCGVNLSLKENTRGYTNLSRNKSETAHIMPIFRWIKMNKTNFL